MNTGYAATRPCTVPTCAGHLRHISTDYLKSTRETKIRLRCDACQRFESIYVNGSTVRVEHRPPGRPRSPRYVTTSDRLASGVPGVVTARYDVGSFAAKPNEDAMSARMNDPADGLARRWPADLHQVAP